MAKMSVDDKLGFDKFVTDEHESHIQINEDYHDEAEIKRLVMACPANLYHYDDGKLVFSHEGCLECGTCRVISGGIDQNNRGKRAFLIYGKAAERIILRSAIPSPPQYI